MHLDLSEVRRMAETALDLAVEGQQGPAHAASILINAAMMVVSGPFPDTNDPRAIEAARTCDAKGICPGKAVLRDPNAIHHTSIGKVIEIDNLLPAWVVQFNKDMTG